MASPLEIASPLEVAALWRLNLLSGYDVSAICMRWLEQNLDHGDADIALFAGDDGLVRGEIAPAFERILKDMNGRAIEEDEAILRTLRLYLAFELTGDNAGTGVHLVIDRLEHRPKRRLVHHPRRRQDRPNEAYAGENLGLEYVLGRFYSLDEIEFIPSHKQAVAESDLRKDLRQAVQELYDHLDEILAK